MERRNRDIKFGVPCVRQHQVFSCNAARFKSGEAGITPDAMLEVHNRLPGMQLGQVANQRIRVNGAAAILTAAADALAQQVTFTN
ncbi:hypothetical protein D3C75_828820 [compost metagenome]